MSEPLVVPSHVSADRVYDFDFFRDPGLLTDPHQRWVELLKTAPEVFYTPRNTGHWVIIGEPAIAEMAQNVDLFSNVDATIPMMPQKYAFHPIDLDPPEHSYYRAALAPLFGPRAINALDAEIRRIAVEMIDKIKDSGGCELSSAVALPLPVLVFMKQMGMDLSRYVQFCEWAADFLDSPDPLAKLAAIDHIHDYMWALIQERVVAPEDDWISAFLASKINGKPADPYNDVAAMCNLLVPAGLDTVKNAILHFAIVLAQRPDLQKRLRQEPSITSEAVEELLRDRSGTNPMRRVRHDGMFRGIEMKKGEGVLFCLPTVGLDGRFVERPLEVDFDRENKAHLAFGAGPHRCVGSHLARLELRIFLDEWMKRIPEFRIKPGTRPEYRPNNVNTVASVHLVW